MKVSTFLFCLTLAVSGLASTGELIRVENIMYPTGELDFYLQQVHSMANDLQALAQEKCGFGNSIELSNINFRLVGDFRSGDGTLNATTYTVQELSALLKCQ